ncbi:MAG: hypothetical protein JNK77_07095 [Saprospiraceae bacterium]|nr:hypothetical protein [Saprospiraceae bacterium]
MQRIKNYCLQFPKEKTKTSRLIYIISVVFIFASTSVLWGQCALDLSGRSVYYNIPISFYFAHENYPCDSIVVFASDAELEQSGCTLTIKAKTQDQIVLLFLRIDNLDTTLLCRRALEVKEYLPFEIIFAGKKGGWVELNELKAQKGFRIGNALDIQVIPIIKSLNLTIYRDGNLTKCITLISNVFSNKEKKLFNSLLRGDRILFSNVIAEDINGARVIINPAEFIVK